jgi:hypothetical protein
MSLLENEAKPILAPLIGDSAGTVIDSRSQLTIATWAVKTAMVFEHFKPSPSRFFEPAECEFLRLRKSPPDCVFAIWIGRCSEFVGFTDYRSLTNGIDQFGRPVKGHVQTMVFGHLVIQLVAIHAHPTQFVVPQYRRSLKAVSGPWELAEIWNLQFCPITWPPNAYSFPDAPTLFNFAERFALTR